MVSGLQLTPDRATSQKYRLLQKKKALVKTQTKVTVAQKIILLFLMISSVTEIFVENVGIAPIYYDAFVTVNGVRSQDSLKYLRPGDVKKYDVASGGVSPILTIESDRLISGQEIEFEADL